MGAVVISVCVVGVTTAEVVSKVVVSDVVADGLHLVLANPFSFYELK